MRRKSLLDLFSWLPLFPWHVFPLFPFSMEAQLVQKAAVGDKTLIHPTGFLLSLQTSRNSPKLPSSSRTCFNVHLISSFTLPFSLTGFEGNLPATVFLCWKVFNSLLEFNLVHLQGCVYFYFIRLNLNLLLIVVQYQQFWDTF